MTTPVPVARRGAPDSATLDRPDADPIDAAATQPPSRLLAGALSVLAGGLCWSFTGVFIRLAPHLDAWQFLVYRGLGVAVAFTLIARSRRRGAILPGFFALGPLGVVAALALSLAAIGFIVALKLTNVANALFLSSCAPLLSAILGFLILGERLGVRQAGATALGFCGLVIIVGGGFEAGGVVGDAWALVCALSFAVVSVCMRLAPKRDFDPAMVAYGVFSALAAAAVCLGEGATLAPPLMEALAAFAAGFVLIGLGFALFLRGAPTVPAVGQTLLAQTETIFGPIWVWLAFGETPAATTLAGGAVILTAVVAMALSGAAAPAPNVSN
jgi:drug/metabolite transporter (DMT)-like permease